MFQSVIIPHRNFNRYLRQCLWSLERSAEACGPGLRDWEVVVVDGGSSQPPPVPANGRVLEVLAPKGSTLFNKPRLLNAGIDHSDGEVLTFLDADTLVGRRFLESAERLLRQGSMALTKLCHRVRRLPLECLAQLEASDAREELLDRWFARYESFAIPFEGYGRPEDNAARDGFHVQQSGPCFGKAEFSILRSTLGDLRYDEEYDGRGYEDLWMNREIARRFGWDENTGEPGDYRAGIVTDAEHALFQIQNPPQGPEWGPGPANKANMERYFAT